MYRGNGYNYLLYADALRTDSGYNSITFKKIKPLKYEFLTKKTHCCIKWDIYVGN